MDVLQESCPTKIYGANPEAEGPAANDYASLGLMATDIHIISRLRAKREYYLQSSTNRKVFDMALGREELLWVGVSDPAAVQEMVALREKHPDRWRSMWTNRDEAEVAA